MRKVAILDLRGNDAWDYDWILVTKSLITGKTTHEIAYKDACGDYVLFDGTEEEAYRFYSKYCESNGLSLIGYDTLEANDIEDMEIFEIVNALSEEQLKYAYKKYQMKLYVNEAKTFVNDFLKEVYSPAEIPQVPDKLYEDIAEEFSKRKNYDIADGCVFRYVIMQYLDKNIDLLPGFTEAYLKFCENLPFC